MTKTTLALFAASAGFASAATTLITTNPTDYDDPTHGEGNWHYQSLTLNDSGFNATGDTLAANVTIQSFSVAKDGGGAPTVGSQYVVVMTDPTDLNSIVAQSTNALDVAGAAGGAVMTWNFANDTLSTSTEYFFAWYLDDNLNGTIEVGETDADARFAMDGDQIAGGTRNAPAGGISGNADALMRIEVNNVPEPSSTALLGLGGLALILRRRK